MLNLELKVIPPTLSNPAPVCVCACVCHCSYQLVHYSVLSEAKLCPASAHTDCPNLELWHIVQETLLFTVKDGDQADLHWPNI